jgi:hypothetical protein
VEERRGNERLGGFLPAKETDFRSRPQGGKLVEEYKRCGRGTVGGHGYPFEGLNSAFGFGFGFGFRGVEE